MQYESDEQAPRIIVHPRIAERHPEISEEDVKSAWRTSFAVRPRVPKKPYEYISVGTDGKGRLLEMVAKRFEDGSWFVFHAMTPPTKKTYSELGL